ncbi:MAG: carbon-nitrogen hydrolase family protein, partial [Glaciecola sp.]
MPSHPINLVAIQLVSSPHVDDNFVQVIQQIEHAQENWDNDLPTLIVLPECFAFFGGKDKEALLLLSDEKQQLLHDKLSDIAKTYHIWLVAGSIPTPSPDP